MAELIDTPTIRLETTELDAVERTPQRRRPWLAVIAVAAAVVAIVGVAVNVSGRPRDTAVTSTAPATAASTNDLLSLVVHDGDVVAASGQVIAAPGQPVQFCGPEAHDLIGYLPGMEPPPTCGFGITVTGVNLDVLTEPGEIKGVRFGQAYLRGTWHDGSIAVTVQTGPVAAPTAVYTPQPPPCSAPAGGWARESSDDTNALHEYVEQHAEQYRQIWMAYPNGVQGSVSPLPYQVVVVEVVNGDVNAARDELARQYHGNLCVVARPDLPSLADQQRLASRVEPLVERMMNDRTNGIYSLSFGDRVQINLAVLTEALLAKLQAVGQDVIDVEPWLRPLH